MVEKTVLLIEDNELDRKLTRDILKVSEYQVLEAADAETGIKMAHDRRPDLILMDIKLPGMDGWEATQLIKKDPAINNIPIIALTSYAMAGDEQKALDAGCDGYLSKPIEKQRFLELIADTSSMEQDSAPLQNLIHRSKVLIVDDEPLNVKLLEAKLSPEKYETIYAYNGKDALQKADNESPDLILLDIMMPGIDGYEVTKRLKKNPKTTNIPIILITALDAPEHKEKGLKVGADEFLNKPVDTAELQARVHALSRLKAYQEQLTTRTDSERVIIAPVVQEDAVEESQEIVSVLLVEDDEKDVRIIETYLSEEPYRLLLAKDAEETLSLVQQETVDLILLDLLLPGMDGFELCRRLKEEDLTKNVQIVVTSCLTDIESKIRGIELGIDGFMSKPLNKEELMARINASLKKKDYLDKLSARFETALSAAITDKLTGLYNHAYLKHFLELEIKRSQRQGHSLAMLMIDFDDFKKYNDTYGHLAGDAVLRECGIIIKKSIREVDLAARYGGEEFAVVLPYSDQGGAKIVAERIRKVIKDTIIPLEDIPQQDPITVSLGISIFPLHAATIDELIQKADLALYRAKREGKDRVCTYEESMG